MGPSDDDQDRATITVEGDPESAAAGATRTPAPGSTKPAASNDCEGEEQMDFGDGNDEGNDSDDLPKSVAAEKGSAVCASGEFWFPAVILFPCIF